MIPTAGHLHCGNAAATRDFTLDFCFGGIGRTLRIAAEQAITTSSLRCCFHLAGEALPTGDARRTVLALSIGMMHLHQFPWCSRLWRRDVRPPMLYIVIINITGLSEAA